MKLAIEPLFKALVIQSLVPIFSVDREAILHGLFAHVGDGYVGFIAGPANIERLCRHQRTLITLEADRYKRFAALEVEEHVLDFPNFVALLVLYVLASQFLRIAELPALATLLADLGLVATRLLAAVLWL